MTGKHTGRDDVDFDSATGAHGESTYDGHTVSGPTAEQAAKGACPNMRPKAPALRVTATRGRHGAYRIKVTARIAGVGANEAAVDTQPVNHARVKLGSAVTYTDKNGVATVVVRRSRLLTVSAGDTLGPAARRL
jgi:hypothetical protein